MNLFLWVVAGILAYCICGTITIAVMSASNQFAGESKGTEPVAFIFWWVIWIVIPFAYLFSGIYDFAKWIATPKKAGPTAPPSSPPTIVDYSAVKALPDPATMPEEFKGKRIDTHG
jgi:hypothetical protein